MLPMSGRPRYSDEQLKAIYQNAGGLCHLCHRPVTWSRFADSAHDGGWEVEHVRTVKHGGSHSMRNLLPAHIGPCNRSRGTKPAEAFRRAKGVTGRPRSAIQVREDNAVGVGVLAAAGTAVGALGGPVGMLLGGAIGSLFGNALSDKQVTPRGSPRAWRAR